MKKTFLLSILFLILSLNVFAQDWQQQYISASTEINSLMKTMRVEIDVMKADRDVADEHTIKRHIETVSSWVNLINNVINNCNAIYFPQDESGMNSMAEIETGIAVLKGDYDMSVSMIKQSSDILQRRVASALVKDLLNKLLQMVISTYAPFLNK